jgi:tetratricopeptide (TPR) repeat protein
MPFPVFSNSKNQNWLVIAALACLVINLSARAAEKSQVDLADELLRVHKNEAAAALLRKVLDQDARNARAWELYGCALDGQNESKTAIDAFSRAIALGRKEWTVYENRGVSHSHLGNFEDAIADFTTALQKGVPLGIQQAAVHCDRADAELSLKRFSAAVDDYSKYLTLSNCDDPSRLTHRARAYAGCGKTSEAIRDMTTYLQLRTLKAKQRLGAYVYRSALYSKSREYDKAISDLSSALAIEPDRTMVLRERAKLYDLVGKTALAEADRAKSKQIDNKLYGDL